MTEDYCKLASGIILSTIWREDDHTRILWITMLAVKGRDHRVLASVPGLAAVANIPVESCRRSLLKLAAPDPDSRTKDHEGRRIAEVDGGWLVLNGEKYRNFLSKTERNEYQRKLMAERRAAQKLARVRNGDKKLAVLGQAEAEAEAVHTPPLPPKGGGESVLGNGTTAFDRIQAIRESLNNLFHQPKRHWTDTEERALVEISKRPNIQAELKAVVDLEKGLQEKKFFPQSVLKCLENWAGLVDRVNKQQATKPKQAMSRDGFRIGTTM